MFCVTLLILQRWTRLGLRKWLHRCLSVAIWRMVINIFVVVGDRSNACRKHILTNDFVTRSVGHREKKTWCWSSFSKLCSYTSEWWTVEREKKNKAGSSAIALCQRERTQCSNSAEILATVAQLLLKFHRSDFSCRFVLQLVVQQIRNKSKQWSLNFEHKRTWHVRLCERGTFAYAQSSNSLCDWNSDADS